MITPFRAEELLEAGDIAVAVSRKPGQHGNPPPAETCALLSAMAARAGHAIAERLFCHLAAAGVDFRTFAAASDAPTPPLPRSAGMLSDLQDTWPPAHQHTHAAAPHSGIAERHAYEWRP